MLACLFVLLHTLVHSSFAATSAPWNPNKVFALLIYFYTGGSRRLLLCSPAGRCGLIGLSQFLWSLPCVFCRVRSVISQSCIPSFTPQRHPTQELSFNRPFRFIPLISLLGAFVFSTHNSCGCSIVPLRSTKLHRPTQKPLTVHSLHFSSLPHSVQPLLFPTHSLPKQKLRQPCRKRQPSAALTIVPGFLLPAPLLHSQSARASPLRWQKNNSAIAPLVFYRFVPAQGCFTCFRFNPASPTPTPDHPPLKKCSWNLFYKPFGQYNSMR